MDTTLASLTGLSSLALAACSLPSATLQPTSSSAPATIVEPPPEQRKPAIRTRGGPVVLDATLTAGGTKLELHVSTPLAPTTGVDPNDFRISMAMAYAYKRYAYAYYYDVGELASDDGELMNIAALHGHGDTLELVLGAPIDPSYCREIEQEMREAEAEAAEDPSIKVNGGLFLHYAPGDTPITDQQGRALAPAAAEWVLHKRKRGEDAYEMYFEGPRARRALRDAIPISCGQ